jgi:hypothetical protein
MTYLGGGYNTCRQRNTTLCRPANSPAISVAGNFPIIWHGSLEISAPSAGFEPATHGLGMAGKASDELGSRMFGLVAAPVARALIRLACPVSPSGWAIAWAMTAIAGPATSPGSRTSPRTGLSPELKPALRGDGSFQFAVGLPSAVRSGTMPLCGSCAASEQAGREHEQHGYRDAGSERIEAQLGS